MAMPRSQQLPGALAKFGLHVVTYILPYSV
jgi:hypothetical protein